jgi:hypothetical protein
MLWGHRDRDGEMENPGGQGAENWYFFSKP